MERSRALKLRNHEQETQAVQYRRFAKAIDFSFSHAPLYTAVYCLSTSTIWRVLIGERDPLLLIWFAGRFSLLLQRFRYLLYKLQELELTFHAILTK